jgi:hypothetical protein
MQVLRVLLREGGDDLLDRRARERLALVLPELRAEGDAQPGSEMDPAQARLGLFEVVADVVRRASQRACLLFVLDDLHVADPSSLALLHFLGRELSTLPVYVVGTCRDHEARLSPERSELFARVAREASFLPLRRFGEEEIRELVARRGGVIPDDRVPEVLRATEGNPLFVEEVLRMLARGRAPSRGAPLPVPETVRETIRARIDLLDEGTRRTLEVAAVVGREVPIATLAAACVGEARDAVDGHARTAVAAGVLVELGQGLFEFAHALVRDAIYDAIDPERRSSLHVAVAETLAREGAMDSGVAEIALHLLAGVSAVGVAKAFEGARSAAERALRAVAFEDAAVIMERTLSALESKLDPRDRAEARLVLGEALIRSGKVREGREVCTTVAAIARELGDPELLAKAGLAYGAEIVVAMLDATLIGMLQEALAKLPERATQLRARTRARLAGALQPAADPQVPMALAREAIAEARGLGDPQTLRVVLHTAGSALVEYADPAERIEVDRQMLELALAANDRDHVLRARRRLFFDHLELGDLRGLEGAIADFTALAEATGRRKHRFTAAMFAAAYAVYQARFDDASAHRARAAGFADPEDVETKTALVLNRLGVAFASWRDVREIEEASADVARLFAAVEGLQDVASIMRCVAHLRAGLGDSRARLASVSLDSPVAKGEPTAIFFLAEGYALLGDRDGVRVLRERVTPYRNRLCTWGAWGYTIEAAWEMVEGMLAAVAGDAAEAELRFAGAIDRCARGGVRGALARALVEAGLHLRLLGRGAVAAERLARGVELAEQLGMTMLVARARGAAIVGSAAAPASRPPSGGASVTSPSFTLVREGEVWSLTTASGTFRLKDTKGLAMLAHLLERPHEEVHVLSLGAAGDPGDLGDAGEVLDKEAVRAYRARVEDLREVEREAESFGDTARAAKARAEIDALACEIAGGVGLGGRHRKAAATAERARVNVQRRVKDAIERIKEHDAALGQYLGWTVRTGTFCVYQPPRR